MILQNINNSFIISNNISSNLGTGLMLDSSNDNTINLNNFTYNAEGILMRNCLNNFFITNIIRNNFGDGIKIEKCKIIPIQDWTISNNEGYGIILESSNDTSVQSSNLNNNLRGILLNNSKNITISSISACLSSEVGILLINSYNNSLKDCNFTNNGGIGIVLEFSNNNTISLVNISNNQDGILLNNSNENRILSDIINTNINYGIYLSSSNNNTISNFNMADNGASGLLIQSSDNNTIRLMNISSNSLGIFLNESNNNDILNTTTNFNTESGIVLLNSDFNLIKYCDLLNNTEYGLMLETSMNNMIMSNISMNGLTGIFLNDSINNDVFNSTVCYNVLNGIHLENSHLNRILKINLSNNIDNGILLELSNNNSMISSTINNNKRGIFLNNSNYSNFTDLTVNYNTISGIHLINSHNNTILNNTNTISDNGQYGICFYQSHYNNIIGNVISNSPYGIYLYQSNNNDVIGNFLAGNDKGIEEVGCTENYIINNQDDSISDDDDGDDNGSDTPNGIDIILILIIGVIIGSVAIASIIVFSKRKEKPETDIEQILTKSKFPKKTMQSSKIIGGKNERLNEAIIKINQFNEEGLKAYNQANYEKAMIFWGKSINELQNMMGEARRLGREDYVQHYEKQIEDLNGQINEAFEKDKNQKATYFKDVSNIRFIVAVHIDMGTTIAKIELTKEELDKDLFGGFLSAISSFKSEMARKIPMISKREEDQYKPTHEMLSQGFNIALYDGEFIRLAFVTDTRLNTLSHKKNINALFNYETKNQQELKYFKGALDPFKDFENFMAKELDLEINNLSVINLANVNKSQFSERAKQIFRELYENEQKFYPFSIPKLMINKIGGLNETEAAYFTYMAFKGGFFFPIYDENLLIEGTEEIKKGIVNNEETIRKLEYYLVQLNDFVQQNNNALNAGQLTQDQYINNKNNLSKEINKVKRQIEKLRAFLGL